MLYQSHGKTFFRGYEAEVESRTQGFRPRTQRNPRPRPRRALPRTDPLEVKDRNTRGQGPRTHAQVLSKKKGLKNFFQDKILTIQKIVLSLSRGQASFRGLEASRLRTWPSRQRPRLKTSTCILKDSTSGTKKARRHGGGIPGQCPPKWLLVPPQTKIVLPPSEDCARKKLTVSGLLECKSKPKTSKLGFTALEFVSKNCFFVIFVDSHRIS